jgi:predicted nucleic acid-binding protein
VVRPLFDTNILIDSVRGVDAATELLERHADGTISIMTWMEVRAGAPPTLEQPTRTFLSRFTILQIDEAIAEEAVLLRRARRLKLPDAIIWASARMTGRTLVTRDIKDFPADDPGVQIPYRLS